MTSDSTFTVRMHCGGCENTVRTILRTTAGVTRAEADHRRSEVRVQFDPELVTEAQLRERLSDSGFEPAPPTTRERSRPT